MVEIMPTINFTVDSELLEELGKRVVGKPYIALAELVKNAYDADATKVRIELNPKEDRIVVNDNGHGMDFTEFRDFWMRIGSRHKERWGVSKYFKRHITGSKGIGRLAVQYLAKKIELRTVSKNDANKKIVSYVEWEKAVKAGDLTKAGAEYDTISSSKESFEQGTTVTLTKLNHEWNSKLIQGLAREIWWLQPPFRSRFETPEVYKKAFEIEFVSTEEHFVETFNWQLRAIMEIWCAKLVGKNNNGKVTLSLQFVEEEQPIVKEYVIDNCKLRDGEFEIRVYHLDYRQPHGIKVGEARAYFNMFGGIHVYDAGFHLPFYGTPDNDWVRVEFDHSHRLSTGQLLQEELRVEGGLSFLPTLSRVFGVVNVDTSKEPDLNILITRDRLQDTVAYNNLVYMIRWAMHFYAMEESKRSHKLKEILGEIESLEFKRVEDALVKHESEIPGDVYDKLRTDIKKATEEIEIGAEATKKLIGLLGVFTTAGISSLAYQHELRQHFRSIEGILEKMEKIETDDKKLRESLNELKEDLSSWLGRAKAINKLFDYMSTPEDVKTKKRFLAKEVVGEIKEHVDVLARGIPIDTNKLDDKLLLPKASHAEWASIFQNVFINAFNALLDSENKQIKVSSKSHDGTREILIQDTGCGVDLSDAEKLFEPYERMITISPERRRLAYGGTGLGLTIVRLLAKNIRCEVSFVKPEKGFNTAFSIKWEEIE